MQTPLLSLAAALVTLGFAPAQERSASQARGQCRTAAKAETVAVKPVATPAWYAQACAAEVAEVTAATTVVVAADHARSHTAANEDLVLLVDQAVAGTLIGRNILVAEGVTVVVEDDLEVLASGTVRVDGTLLVRDVQGILRRSAQRIRIQAAERITINGAILGGRGRDLRDLPTESTLGVEGGDGTSIALTAPDIAVFGLVRSGAGGHGGGAARGGNGGSIVQVGRHVTDLHTSPSSVAQAPVAGAGWVLGGGGRGGDSPFPPHSGGHGGDAGGLEARPHPAEPDWDFAVPVGGQGPGWEARKLEQGSDPCPAGKNGKQDPPGIQGANGGDGGHGADGTALSPNGTGGGHGGHAAAITGPPGQGGQKGADSCDDGEPRKGARAVRAAHPRTSPSAREGRAGMVAAATARARAAPGWGTAAMQATPATAPWPRRVRAGLGVRAARATPASTRATLRPPVRRPLADLGRSACRARALQGGNAGSGGSGGGAIPGGPGAYGNPGGNC